MYLYGVLLAATVISLTSARVLDVSSKQNLWERSGKFQGDIVLTDAQKNGVTDTNLRWPNRVMPVQIDGGFSEDEKNTIRQAMNEYNTKTCVTVRESNPSDPDFVYVKKDEPGCWSYVGKLGGRQVLNLGDGCVWVGTAAHEMLHALGFYHMQSATERDDYVIIHWENIQDGQAYNFDKYDSNMITSFGIQYDYGSIMHYGAYAFSKNGEKTIEPKDPNAEIGQSNGLSDRDIQKLNIMYGC